MSQLAKIFTGASTVRNLHKKSDSWRCQLLTTSLTGPYRTKLRYWS